jgi:hypothetical protein
VIINLIPWNILTVNEMFANLSVTAMGPNPVSPKLCIRKKKTDIYKKYSFWGGNPRKIHIINSTAT